MTVQLPDMWKVLELLLPVLFQGIAYVMSFVRWTRGVNTRLTAIEQALGVGETKPEKKRRRARRNRRPHVSRAKVNGIAS